MNATRRMRAALPAVLLLSVCLCGRASAQSVEFTEREVSFRNGPVELRGTLLLPMGQGRYPAIVFLHGSGPATRAGARPYAAEFARIGIASLFFDKRGSGESGGSWVTSSLDDLADDALAALEYLKTEGRIDPGRIGFWGVSQAGWVATLAASRSEEVAFMILISGGGASPRESELFSYQQVFERAGLTAGETAEASDVLDAYFQYLATGVGRAALAARIDAARDSRWYPLAPLDRILPSEENRPNWSWVATWDPAPHIERLKSPILLLFGDRDTEQPTEIAIARWREGLAKAGNDEVTLVVFPGAGHGIRMRESRTDGDHSSGGRAPFADGYTEVMLGWLWRHVAGATPQERPTVDPACAAPQHRQFDFWLGSWTVTDTSGTVLGVNDVTRIARGCGLREQWRGARGGEGMSLNAWQPTLRQWTQFWVGTGVVLTLSGGLDSLGRMVLQGRRQIPEGVLFDRITWTQLNSGGVRQEWDESRDGGESWRRVFTGLYRPREPADP